MNGCSTSFLLTMLRSFSVYALAFVGEACKKYESIFKHPRGLYISLKEKGKILGVLKNWPERSIQVIVVNDGERILGLGDLGSQCLPITNDVWTNNEKLLKDEFYVGLRQRRATGKRIMVKKYSDRFLHHNAFELLEKYGFTHLVFNDDIQVYGNIVVDLVTDCLKSCVV
ncbi:hypothetical protein LOK49_Contig29G00016 [Camellia lanceoleosa]|nr:hypothetical protein LOK49_Contig29G00016 [Camellia lanceoleosa]